MEGPVFRPQVIPCLLICTLCAIDELNFTFRTGISGERLGRGQVEIRIGDHHGSMACRTKVRTAAHQVTRGSQIADFELFQQRAALSGGQRGPGKVPQRTVRHDDQRGAVAQQRLDRRNERLVQMFRRHCQRLRLPGRATARVQRQHFAMSPHLCIDLGRRTEFEQQAPAACLRVDIDRDVDRFGRWRRILAQLCDGLRRHRHPQRSQFSSACPTGA